MKIAFIGYEDINDPFLWSGIPFTLYNKFKISSGVHVKVITSYNIKIKFPISVLFKRFVYNKLFGYNFGVYRFDRELWCIKANAKHINTELEVFKPDIILCCTAYQINEIKTTKPIFIYTDATFELLNTYYTDYMRYCKFSVKEAQIAEEIALKKATGIIFSSNWAKQSAITDYHIAQNKIHIVPFGSNLIIPDNYQLKLHKKIDTNHFSLIFIGYDDERKGLAKAIEIHTNLITKGIASKLTIIGPDKLNSRYHHVPNLKFIGKIDKKKADDYKKLLDAYDDAHFLILPTKADCTPIVFSEAASLAIPTITHSVGGNDEIIMNNFNGIKLPLSASADEFAAALLIYIHDHEAYNMLRNNAYHEYKSRLNWVSATSSILSIFKSSMTAQN